MFGGRLYSDKPPVLPAFGAVVYWPLERAGLRFVGNPPGRTLGMVNWVLVVSLVGGCSVLAIYSLRRLLQWVDLPAIVSDLLALGCGLGTLLWTYGVTFNNHSVAAGLIGAGFSSAFVSRGSSALTSFLAGFFTSLAATIDLPSGGAMAAALAVAMAVRGRVAVLLYLAGCVGPLALHWGLQSRITGTPWPVEMYPEAFEYPGSYWTTPAGIFRESGPRWRFGLEFLLGPQGWITVTPLFLLTPVGLIQAIRGSSSQLRSGAIVTASVLVLVTAYYVWGVRRTDFSGQSYGVRHLLGLVVPCYFFACLPLASRRGFVIAAFVVLWTIGAVYSYFGMRDPWSRIENRPEAAVRVLQRGVLYPFSSYKR
jgi:hypothetical protein